MQGGPEASNTSRERPDYCGMPVPPHGRTRAGIVRHSPERGESVPRGATTMPCREPAPPRALAYAGPEGAAPLTPPHTGTAPIGRRSTPQETPSPLHLVDVGCSGHTPSHPFILLRRRPSRLKRQQGLTELRQPHR